MTASPLEGIEGIVCDLDGVVYAGPPAIPHAISSLFGCSVPVVYATNNASRPPGEVAAHLRSLGLTLADTDVVTSSVAGARRLAERLGAGGRVMAVGGPGVAQAIEAEGLVAVQPGDAEVSAVLQGYGPEVTATQLAEAAVAIRGGAWWVATNEDLTLPTERGPVPGNGSFVAAVVNAVDMAPEVVGKPHAPMYLMAAEQLGTEPARVLAIGDRLETDIAGAHAAGTRSAFVLTGVHGLDDLAAAPPDQRPDYVLTDLRGLTVPYPQSRADGGWHVRGDGRARLDGDHVEAMGDGLDRHRAALDLLWEAVDAGRVGPDRARSAMQELGSGRVTGR